MYSRNCGSNWPRSCAHGAQHARVGVDRPRAHQQARRGDSGLQPCGWCFSQWRAMSILRATQAFFVLTYFRNLSSAANSSGPANQPAVQPDRHHPRAFGIQDVEAVAQVIEELRAGTKTLWRGEAHVVRVQRVRHDELRLAMAGVVPGQVVVVVVGVVDEAAVLDHQAPRVRAGAAGVPAERRSPVSRRWISIARCMCSRSTSSGTYW